MSKEPIEVTEETAPQWEEKRRGGRGRRDSDYLIESVRMWAENDFDIFRERWLDEKSNNHEWNEGRMHEAWRILDVLGVKADCTCCLHDKKA